MSRDKKSKKPSSSASRSPATPLRRLATDDSDEGSNRRVLSDAAVRFPYLISESAICGVVCGTEALSSNHSKIYLSQSFLASYSLCSNHLVSVALAGSDKEPSHKLPLYNFVENYIANFGIDSGDSLSNNVGSYFAIANVSSCDKLQKNEARLSWALSCTMGFPAIGQPLFISPIGDFSSSHYEININNTCHLRSHKCRNLNLNMLPFTFIGSIDFASIKNGYGEAELPKTRSNHSKLPSASKNYPRLSGGFYSSVFNESTLKLALVDEETKLLREKFAYKFLYGRYLLHGNLFAFPVLEKVLFFTVEDAEQYTAFYVDAKTKISFSGTTTAASESSSGRVFPEENISEFISGGELNDRPKLGGLSKEFADLEEIIKFSLAQKDPLLRYSGVLLHGPPGTGKTTMVSCCVREAGARLFLVNGPEIVSQYYGESEQALQKIFDSARTAAPAVVFIDELDAIAPSRAGGGEELSLRMVATLLKLMDDIKKSGGILVIAATNRPDSIDTALRRPGRFDREIEIGVPSPVQRLDILRTLLNHIDHSLCNVELESLAFDTHGFVGADLAALCNEAAMTSLCRFISFKSSEKLLKCSHSKTRAVDTVKQVPKIQEPGEVPCNDDLNSISSFLSELTMSSTPASPDSSCCGPKSSTECCSYDSHGDGQKTLLKVTVEDFQVAKTKVRPSSMREVMLELPKVSWENIGGQIEVKRQLIEAIQWPQMHPDAFKRIGVHPPRGLLLIGPPGCSKTLMARAVASEAKLNFLAVKGPELFSKWVGESEKAVRSIFAKARANAPAIIFFDEIDGLAVTRGAENDGLGQRVGVTVIAATNRPDKIDPALLRPGRFDRIVDVQPPNKSDREDIFRIHTREMPCGPEVSPSELARLTPGYTGADIKLVCREAAVAALEETLEISVVSMEHFRIGIMRVHPSEVSFYQKLAEQFRSNFGGLLMVELPELHVHCLV